MDFRHDSHTEESNRKYLLRVIGRTTPCQNEDDIADVQRRLEDYVDNGKLGVFDALGSPVVRYIIENDIVEGLKLYMDLQCWGGALTVDALQRQLQHINVQIDQSKSPQIFGFIQEEIERETPKMPGGIARVYEYDSSYYESGNESDYV